MRLSGDWGKLALRRQRLCSWRLPFLSWGRCRCLCTAGTSPARPWPGPVWCASPPPRWEPDTPLGNRTPPAGKKTNTHHMNKSTHTYADQESDNPEENSNGICCKWNLTQWECDNPSNMSILNFTKTKRTEHHFTKRPSMQWGGESENTSLQQHERTVWYMWTANDETCGLKVNLSHCLDDLELDLTGNKCHETQLGG